MAVNTLEETTRVFVAHSEEYTDLSDPERTKTITYYASQDIESANQSFEHTAIVRRRYGQALHIRNKENG